MLVSGGPVYLLRGGRCGACRRSRAEFRESGAFFEQKKRVEKTTEEIPGGLLNKSYIKNKSKKKHLGALRCRS